MSATQLLLPPPVTDTPERDEPQPEPPADPWERAFEDLRNWKAQAWAEGDEDGAE